MGSVCLDTLKINQINLHQNSQNENSDKPSQSFAYQLEQHEIHKLTDQSKHQRSKLYDEGKQNKLQQPNIYQQSPFKSDKFYRLKEINIDYCGEWKKGLPHGHGTIIFQNGSWFEGYFVNGLANCPDSYYVSSNGAFYRGQIKNNQRSGRGTLKHNGYQYNGEWNDNLPHGKGTQIFANADRFQGQFREGKKIKGVYKWAKSQNFIQFNGSFENCLFKQGKLMVKNNSEFKCNFDYSQQCQINNVKATYEDIVFEGQLVQYKQGLYPKKGFTLSKEQFYAFECFLEDQSLYGMIQNPKKGKIFDGKVVIDYDEQMERSEINRILTIIERQYQKQNILAHSDALKNIQKELYLYDCQFIQQAQSFASKRLIVCVQICEKTILVNKKI